MLNRLDSLHSVRHVGQKIMELTRDLDYDIRVLTRCVQSDPALAAKIMRVSNSSYYGLGQRVNSLQQALVYFGQRSLRLIALTFSLVDHLTKGLSRDLTQGFWWRTITMAVVANRLAERTGSQECEDAYSAGLLADLGVLVFGQVVGEQYASLYTAVPHGPELLKVERKRFGFAHPALSARLLQRWDFPETIVAAAARHHDAQTEHGSLPELLVRTAVLVTDALWDPENPRFDAAQQSLESHFGIGAEQFVEFAAACNRDIQQNAELFRIHLRSSIDCEELQERTRRQLAEVSISAAFDIEADLHAL